MAELCPDCGAPLLSSVNEGRHVAGCQVCGGTWLDDGQLAALAKTIDSLARLEREYVGERKPAGQGSGCCPRDGTALTQRPLKQAPSIKLCVCGQCRGVWAPEGSLSRLAASLAGVLPGSTNAVSATAAPRGGEAAKVFRRRWHPVVDTLIRLAVVWLVALEVARFYGPSDIGLWGTVAVIALWPFVPHTVTVDQRGLRLRGTTLRWTVPWRSVWTCQIIERGAGRWGRYDDDAPTLADLFVASAGSYGASRVPSTTRVWLAGWRGIYSFGYEWRDHGGLIDAIVRAYESE